MLWPGANIQPRTGTKKQKNPRDATFRNSRVAKLQPMYGQFAAVKFPIALKGNDVEPIAE